MQLCPELRFSGGTSGVKSDAEPAAKSIQTWSLTRAHIHTRKRTGDHALTHCREKKKRLLQLRFVHLVKAMRMRQLSIRPQRHVSSRPLITSCSHFINHNSKSTSDRGESLNPTVPGKLEQLMRHQMVQMTPFKNISRAGKENRRRRDLNEMSSLRQRDAPHPTLPA